jgi:hypothetical protein
MAGKPLIQMADAVKTFLNFSTDRDKKKKQKPQKKQNGKKKNNENVSPFFLLFKNEKYL